MTDQEIIKLFQAHGLKIWMEPNKKRWCISGQAGIIAVCLKATRANFIQIQDQKYPLEEVTHQIYQLAEIKLAFQQLIFE
ncbi:hypothetical protein [uncultured Victivallis sp.]|uniref:hypothetical protein n=1 Tax=uncultured Victivallis sp. TaxID=354118 RepID=UPI0025968DE7|nr:hypothetical protein [uncultured Victivallis sp.]